MWIQNLFFHFYFLNMDITLDIIMTYIECSTEVRNISYAGNNVSGFLFKDRQRWSEGIEHIVACFLWYLGYLWINLSIIKKIIKKIIIIHSSRKYKMERVHILSFFTYTFLNVDISFNMYHQLFKLCEVILDIIMEGTVSQILYRGPRSNFMWIRKCFPNFDIK